MKSKSKGRRLSSILTVFLSIISILVSFQTYSQGTKLINRPEREQVSLLINQVGYDVNGEKILVVQLRDSLNKEAGHDFQLINNLGKIVFTGKLIDNGRVNKDTPGDWGAHYLSGNFSNYNTKGEYKIRVTVGNEEHFSFPFRIGPNLVFEETIMPADKFFLYQRCGFEVPGIHPACHLDDAIVPDSLGVGRKETVGGWHDAGDYNKYATIACRSVYALLIAARDVAKPDLAEESRNVVLDEGLWGAEWLLKMWQPGKGIIYQEVWNGYAYEATPDKETDNVVGTKDDRPFRGEGPSAMTAAALAAAARATGRKDYREAAEDLWLGAVKSKCDYPEDIWAIRHNIVNLGSDKTARLVRRTADLLLADIELEALTGDKRYVENAQSCIESIAREQQPDGIWPTDVYSRSALQGVPPASLALFVHIHPENSASVTAKKSLRLWLKRLNQLTNSPFRLIPWSEGVFFNPNIGKYWWNGAFINPELPYYYYVGQNSQYLSNAWALYLTAQVLKEPGAANLANRQVDWILGVNPYNLCMMEGRGSYNSPNYLHWAPDNNRGAVPGAIPNGFCRLMPGKDIPWLDLYKERGSYNTTEPWEPHNAFYILAVSARANVIRK